MKVSALFVFLYIKYITSDPDYSKTKRLRNDAKNNPFTWFIFQKLSALGKQLEKLREVTHENRKNANTKSSVLQNKLEKFGSNLETSKPQNNDYKLIKQMQDLKYKKSGHVMFKNSKIFR